MQCLRRQRKKIKNKHKKMSPRYQERRRGIICRRSEVDKCKHASVCSDIPTRTKTVGIFHRQPESVRGENTGVSTSQPHMWIERGVSMAAAETKTEWWRARRQNNKAPLARVSRTAVAPAMLPAVDDRLSSGREKRADQERNSSSHDDEHRREQASLKCAVACGSS